MGNRTDQNRRETLKRLSRAMATAAWVPWAAMEAARAKPPGSKVELPPPSVTAIQSGNAYFFTPEEKELVAAVADLIIPTDEVSPGARAAGVHDWIDFIVANSPPDVQQRWREGIALLDRWSEETAGQRFRQLDRDQQRKQLEKLAEREESPTSPVERFFAMAKEATVDGFYTSEIGLMKDLRYQGGSATTEPTCPGNRDNR